MSKKKEILFVMNNLNVGGAEKALVSLLQVFNYEKYNVDLLLFKKEGLFLSQIPPEVNILKEPRNYRYFDMPFFQVLSENFFNLKWNVIWQRIQFKRTSKKATNPAQAEQFGWKPLAKTLKPLAKQYDVAIGFLEKNPNYFVIDKVISKTKLAFIHTDYNKIGMSEKVDFPYIEKFDKVFVVSNESKKTIQYVFPQLKNKFLTFQNILSEKTIKKLSKEKIEDLPYKNLIISVGRLTVSKGYDRSVEALHILKKKGIEFTWIILGEGELQNKLVTSISHKGLINNVLLLGNKENPYPYILKADIFLHASDFEGDGIAVSEAKVLLKPIVLTDFATARNHIEDNVTGLIVEFNANKIAEALEKLINNRRLRESFSENLSKENWGTEHEIEKLYQLIES